MTEIRAAKIRDLGSVLQPSPVVPRLSNAWRIRATFAGKLPPKPYLTPDLRHTNPGWGDEIFNRQIESIEFLLPTGHRIVLSGMEAYNFFVEASDSLSGKSGARIEAFWLCGKLPHQDLVEMWRIGEGKVVRQRRPWGQEWGGTATRGWKLGLIGSKPVSAVVNGH
jgi:hypothetical protein